MKVDNIAVIKNELKFSRLLTDIFIVTGILVLPIISHGLSIPFYLFEPMRLAVVYILFFDSKYHAYRLAIMLPILSYTLSGHPLLFKALLISIELCIQVFTINYLKKIIIILPLTLSASIFISKLSYYFLKWFFIQFNFINTTLISTNLTFQLIPVFIIIISLLMFRDKINDEN